MTWHRMVATSGDGDGVDVDGVDGKGDGDLATWRIMEECITYRVPRRTYSRAGAGRNPRDLRVAG
jgi:hypothetical protein